MKIGVYTTYIDKLGFYKGVKDFLLKNIELIKTKVEYKNNRDYIIQCSESEYSDLIQKTNLKSLKFGLDLWKYKYVEPMNDDGILLITSNLDVVFFVKVFTRSSMLFSHYYHYII